MEPDIDTSVAHSARVHDYWLGGTDNFAADLRDPPPILAQAARTLGARSAMWGGVARKPPG
jgi:hypothetical protein